MGISLHLLILDDAPDDAELMVEAIRPAGFDIEWQHVETKTDFLKHLNDGIDLILSDYHVPGFGGEQALELLRQSGLDTPFIIVTGTLGDEKAVDLIKRGATDYVLKDNMVRLGEAVRRALDETRLRHEYQQAEANVHERERRFANLLESAPGGIVVIDEAGRIDMVNTRTEEMFGYAREELKGQPMDMLLPERLRAAHSQHVRNYYSSPGHRHIGARPDLVARRKNGEEFPAEIGLSHITDGSHALAIAFIVDITTRKEAEKKVQAERDKAQQYLDVAGVLLMALNRDGEVTMINRKGCEILGYDGESELLGKDWVETWLPEDIRPALRGTFMSLIAGDLEGLRYVENDVLTKSGERRTIAWSNSLLFDETGEINGVLSSGEDITERKRAEQALLESQERFQQLADSIDEVFFLVDVTSNEILYINPAHERMWGRSREKIHTLDDLLMDIHPDDRAAVLSISSQADPRPPVEFRIIRPDQSIRRILSQTYPVLDSNGQVIRLAGIAKDVTEQRLAEAAEREQRLLAEALRDTAADVNSSLDLNQVLDRILENVGRVLPHDAKTIMLVEGGVARIASHRGYVERGLGEAVSAVNLTIADVPNLTQMAHSGRSLAIPDVRSYPGWHANKATDWIESYIGAPIRVGGEVLGFISLDSATPGYFNDKQAEQLQAFADQAAVAIRNAKLYQELETYNESLEQAVADRTAELMAAKERVETILSSIGDALVVLRVDGRIEQVNPAFEQQTGYSAVEAEGQDHHDMLKLEFGSKGDYQTALATLAPGKVWKGQTKVRRKDNSTYDADLTIAPIRDPRGAIRLLVASIRDITPLKEVERLKDAFVSNVSHELRTPITSIVLNLDLLQHDPVGSERYLVRLTRETKRLNVLIEDLLRLSRLDQGRVELKLAPTDLAALAGQYVADRHPLAESRGVSLTLGNQEKAPPVMADEGLLGQAVSVLLTNALNYTPSGGVVTIATRRQDMGGRSWAGISVTDTGPGISADERHSLFERFYRGKVGRASGAPGTGLGLAIAKEIMDQLHGRIEVESEGIPGKGAIFTLWLLGKEVSHE